MSENEIGAGEAKVLTLASIEDSIYKAIREKCLDGEMSLFYPIKKMGCFVGLIESMLTLNRFTLEYVTAKDHKDNPINFLKISWDLS